MIVCVIVCDLYSFYIGGTLHSLRSFRLRVPPMTPLRDYIYQKLNKINAFNINVYYILIALKMFNFL